MDAKGTGQRARIHTRTGHVEVSQENVHTDSEPLLCVDHVGLNPGRERLGIHQAEGRAHHDHCQERGGQQLDG
jgi:hypothetical protein